MSCNLGCTDECKARLHGCASECPALPWQPGATMIYPWETLSLGGRPLTVAEIDEHNEQFHPPSSPAPLGVECAMPDTVNRSTRLLNETGPYGGGAGPWFRDDFKRRPYIPAGCDHQGRVEAGRRASEVVSDWAGLQSEAMSRRVGPWAWLGAGVVLVVLGAAAWLLGSWVLA